MGQRIVTRAGASALVAVLLAGCGTSANSGAGGCVRPGVEVSPHNVSAGASLAVSGLYFLATCGDTLDNGTPSRSTGAGRIRILLSQGGKSTVLGHGDPDQKTGNFSSTITIPGTSAAGPATITTDYPGAYGDDVVITK